MLKSASVEDDDEDEDGLTELEGTYLISACFSRVHKIELRKFLFQKLAKRWHRLSLTKSSLYRSDMMI